MDKDRKKVTPDASEDEIDLMKIINIFLRNWYWFVLFGFIGTILAFGYIKLSKPSYEASTTLMIPDKSNVLDTKDLFQGAFNQPKTNLYNQIELISSFQNIRNTLERLNWRTSWYRKQLFIWRSIYHSEPYDVQEPIGFFNPGGLPIHITPLPNDRYKISVHDKFLKDGNPISVNFDAVGTFGQPFKNEYLNFTLLQKNNSTVKPEGPYYFVFNDLIAQTKEYQKRLTVKVKDDKSEIITCTLRGEQPEKESEFLNQLVSVYIAQKLDFQNESQRRSLNFINEQLSGVADSLSVAGNKFSQFRSKNNIIDLSAEGNLVMTNLKDLESEKSKSQIQLDYFRNLLSYLEKSQNLKELVSPSVVGIEDASLNAMVLKLSELYNRRQVILFSAKENNPAIVQIDHELAQLRSQLIENLRNLIANASRSIAALNEHQSAITVKLNKLPIKEQQMINIQRQFDLTNEVYTFLLQKRAETNIALASSTADVQVIDHAQPETAVKTSASTSVILAVGFLLGILLPSIVILLRNFFDTRIRTQDDVTNATTIPILSNILHSSSATDLAVVDNPRSPLTESFRKLRTNLKFMLNGSAGNVICIHSTNPGEGKSFTSTNLASILAMNDKKVVLVGADLRKPRLHNIFNFDNEHGLTTYLIGVDSAESILRPTLLDNLWFIASGPIPPNPAEMLEKPKLKALIDQLRQQFDYIIIDNAPVSLVTDGLTVGQLADVNIFILRYGISHRHNLEFINEMADQETMKHLALVVNDIKSSAFGYSYYRNYEYGAYEHDYYGEDKSGKQKKRKKKA